MAQDRRTALVTGGARGLGWAIAERLLADGYCVAVLDVNERALGRLDEAQARHGDALLRAAGSVLELDDVQHLMDDAIARWGRLDALVNNAGLNRPGGLFEHDQAMWDAVIEVNLRGTFLCTRAAAERMRDAIQAGRQPGGALVAIGSVAGAVGEGSPAYAASKAGLIGFTKNIAHSLGPLGIRANLVAPGVTRTEWVERNLPPEQLEATAARNPLRRLGEPADIAAAVAFLCSDDARHVTGQVISVSGGEWMP